MSSTYRFLAVLAAFALAAIGTIWIVADAQRANAARSFAELEASDLLLNSMLIRESSLRGFAQTREEALLAPYPRANTTLATDLGQATRFAEPGDGEAVDVESMTRISRRWGEVRKQPSRQSGAAGRRRSPPCWNGTG